MLSKARERKSLVKVGYPVLSHLILLPCSLKVPIKSWRSFRKVSAKFRECLVGKEQSNLEKATLTLQKNTQQVQYIFPVMNHSIIQPPLLRGGSNIWEKLHDNGKTCDCDYSSKYCDDVSAAVYAIFFISLSHLRFHHCDFSILANVNLCPV